MSVKKEKSPSLFGVYFYAILMALFGALLGFAYLLTFPAQAFSSQKEYEASLSDLEEPLPAPKPGDAYYVEGPINSSLSWVPKRELLKSSAPQTVRFSAGEINGWVTDRFRPGVPPSGEDETNILVVPGVPNVAITDAGTMYFNLPTTISAYGSKNTFTVSARCVFDGAEIHLKTVQVGSAKLPFPNLLGSRLMAPLAQSFQSTGEYEVISGALARVESIEIVGGELVLKLR